MELQDYTTEQLKAELKRRAEAARQERLSVDRCRNCMHLITEDENWYTSYKCGARTFFMKGRKHNYIVTPSKKACEKYKRKD